MFEAALRPLFDDAGWRFHAATPDRWYVQPDPLHPPIGGGTPEQVLGAYIDDALPPGDGGRHHHAPGEGHGELVLVGEGAMADGDSPRHDGDGQHSGRDLADQVGGAGDAPGLRRRGDVGRRAPETGVPDALRERLRTSFFQTADWMRNRGGA